MAIDATASYAYTATRFAHRNARTCAQGTDGQKKYIADLTRDIHAARVAQVHAAHASHGPHASWTDATVAELLQTMGTAEDAVARQMSAPLVYSSPGAPGTIDTLKATLQRERAQLRAQTPAVAPPSTAVAGTVELQEGKTYRSPDGRVFHIVRGSSGYLYGRLYVSTGHREGYWDYYQGIRRVEGLQLLTLEEAQEFGQLTGQCCECQTPLKDPVSIVLGIGPICEENFTGRARSRSKKFRAEVLARATEDQRAQMSEKDRAALSADAANCPF